MQALRRLARERLARGTVPREPAWSTLAGLSDGTHYCVLCDGIIASLLIYRVFFPNGSRFHFDARCHDAWLVERRALAESENAS